VTRTTALLLALLAGCAYGEEHASQDDAVRAQEDAGVRLYWAGESFEGFPFTTAEVYGRGRALFVYGECDGESEGIDGFHCTKPQLQVQFLPFDAVGWKIASGCRTVASIRSVPTLHHGGLVLVTKDGIVKTFGQSAAQSRRLALALRGLTGSSGDALPSPTDEQRRVVAEACPSSNSTER
jgi:hypothetical protein